MISWPQNQKEIIYILLKKYIFSPFLRPLRFLHGDFFVLFWLILLEYKKYKYFKREVFKHHCSIFIYTIYFFMYSIYFFFWFWSEMGLVFVSPTVTHIKQLHMYWMQQMKPSHESQFMQQWDVYIAIMWNKCKTFTVLTIIFVPLDNFLC